MNRELRWTTRASDQLADAALFLLADLLIGDR